MTMDIKMAKKQVRILYIITFVLLALAAYSIYNTNHKAYVNCKTVLSLQDYAISTIDRSSKTLPTISYYKNPDHKDELARQLKFNEEYKQGFPQLKCSNNIFS